MDIFAERFQIIGEEFVISESCQGRFEENVLAREDCDIAYIDKQSFDAAIGGNFSDATAYNEAEQILKQVSLLSGLSQVKFQALVKALQVVSYRGGEMITTENQSADKFYIVKEGYVDVLKNGQKLRTISKNDYFGEHAIIFNDFRSNTLVASGDCQCWQIDKSNFLELIDENIRTQLLQRIELQDDSIQLNELTIVKVLGKGMFGNVYLVVNPSTGTLYALKTITRRKIEKYRIQENVKLER